MCGLAGAVSPHGVSARRLRAMADALTHRGPDGRGYLAWRDGEPLALAHAAPARDGATVGLAHNRLTIIDLSEANAQPMVDAERGLALAYNGEIYNYVELRDELRALGHEFGTTGDTEVVLAAYRQWGRECVQRFIGMWAFALLDARERTVLLSRDRFGIKPLYWATVDGELVFASEIKALLAAGVSREPNEDAVRRYLLTGRVDESHATFFAAVQALPHAHDALVDLDRPGVAPRRYWSAPAPSADARLPADAEERFAALLADSVRVHARSDVPVGTCLSGGLDSSAIVCVAEGLRRDELIPRYSHHGIGYLPAETGAVSERPYMEAVVAQTGIEMTYVAPGTEEVVRRIRDVVRAQDEPFGTTSIVAQWFVFQGARAERLKVMLDGQGADEVLGGYHGYRRLLAEEHLRRRRPLAFAVLAAGHRRSSGEWPVAPRLVPGLLWEGERGWHADGVSEAPWTISLMSERLRADSSARDWQVEPPGPLEDALRRHTTAIGLPALLRFEDRNSMTHSIESRVPFLDHRLVEFALALPTRAKVRGAQTKAILRRSLRGVLPDAVRERRDKIAFRAEPAATWLLAERERDALLEARNDSEARWLDHAAIARLIDTGARTPDSEFALWRVLNVKLWLREVVGAD